MSDTELRGFLDASQQAHAQQPRATADALLERAAGLPADDEGAEAVRLAEHVMLGHLGDADALQRFVQALAGQRPDVRDPGVLPTDAWTTAVQRARWAAAAVAGDTGVLPELADAPRWRALQNVVLAHVLAGHGAEASSRLRRDEAGATTHADPDARRAYAICANNVALELREGARGDATRDALMLEAAALARRAWAAAGTWLHVERADYQLARCHAVLGQGAPALAFARACLDACVAHGAPADERFFAHEALWHAHQAAAGAASAAAERSRMQALLAEIDDAEMHGWCEQVLAILGAARP